MSQMPWLEPPQKGCASHMLVYGKKATGLCNDIKMKKMLFIFIQMSVLGNFGPNTNTF